MRVLVHYPAPGTPPVGVWWLPGSRANPKARYLDEGFYDDGVRAVLGVRPSDADEDFGILSGADWDAVCDRLTNTQNPFVVFTDHETKSPESLLTPAAVA